MSTTNHYLSLMCRVAWLVPLVGVALGFLLYDRASRLEPCPENRLPATTLSFLDGVSLGDIDWGIVEHRGGGVAPRNLGTLAKRFRLAGTFVKIDSDVRRAILDDLSKGGVQRIVGEGDLMEESIKVVRILQRQVTLEGPNGEEQLWLSFSNKLSSASGTGRTTGTTGDVTRGGDIEGGYNDFGGKRVGENRWLFRREVLMDYYQELMDDPDRLLAVFDSLEPVWTPERKIDGYRLNVKGEADFFAAVGLLPGDRIISVNQVKMTNRRRAEYFIRQFANNGVSAFVIEFERAGKVQKLIYQVR